MFDVYLFAGRRVSPPGSPAKPGARGHAARALEASGREVAAYGLVALAGVLRVIGPMTLPAHRSLWLVGAALAWSLALGLYLSVFTPWLMAGRIDGRDG